MSYCRWSTDDFQCDLYCYEDVAGGFTTHVAGRRVVYQGELPPPIPLTPETVKEWAERHTMVMEMHQAGTMVDINLPFAGESFNDDTQEDFLIRLLELKDIGYRFPESVIDAVKEEIADSNPLTVCRLDIVVGKMQGGS